MREPLPDLTNQESLNQSWVDATPDGGYALRILEAFRRRCDCEYRTAGLMEAQTAFYERLNRTHRERATELDRAIAILRGVREK
jgi:hypothetical protein